MERLELLDGDAAVVLARVPSLHQDLQPVAERTTGQELAVELLEELEPGVGRRPGRSLGLLFLGLLGRGLGALLGLGFFLLLGLLLGGRLVLARTLAELGMGIAFRRGLVLGLVLVFVLVLSLSSLLAIERILILAVRETEFASPPWAAGARFDGGRPGGSCLRRPETIVKVYSNGGRRDKRAAGGCRGDPYRVQTSSRSSTAAPHRGVPCQAGALSQTPNRP